MSAGIGVEPLVGGGCRVHAPDACCLFGRGAIFRRAAIGHCRDDILSVYGYQLRLLARGIYRLAPGAWWVVLALCVLLGISNVLTFARIDPREMYRLMGYSKAQLQQLQGLNILNSDWIACLSGLSILPMLGYLLYVRRFFCGPSRTSLLVEK